MKDLDLRAMTPGLCSGKRVVGNKKWEAFLKAPRRIFNYIQDLTIGKGLVSVNRARIQWKGFWCGFA